MSEIKIFILNITNYLSNCILASSLITAVIVRYPTIIESNTITIPLYIYNIYVLLYLYKLNVAA